MSGLNPTRDEDKLRDACNALEAITFGGLVAGQEVPGIRELIREQVTARKVYEDAFKEAYDICGESSVAAKERWAEGEATEQAHKRRRADGRVETAARISTNLRALIDGYRSLVASSREMARP